MTAAEAFALASQYFTMGQAAAAQQLFRYVVDLEPRHAAALHALAILTLQAGNWDEAIALLRRATEAEPAHAPYWNDLSVACSQAGDFAAAIAAGEEAVRLQPDNAQAYSNLGYALLFHGEPASAVERLKEAVRLKPDFALAYGNLGTALKQLGKRPEAAEALVQAVRLDPQAADAANLAGMLFQELNNLPRAIEYYRHALRVRPGHADASNNLATALKEQGALDEAVAQYRETLRIQPEHPFAYYNLSQFVAEGRLQFSGEDFARLRSVLANEQKQNLERSVIGFALAGVLDAQGEYEEAFRHYQQANELRRSWLRANRQGFDPERHHQFVSDIIATFDRTYFERVQGWGTESEMPIFIVGMPRSGTTLISHILASHPSVFGAGELGAFPQLMADRAGTTIISSDLPFPEPFADATEAHAAAAQYLERLTAVARGAPRVATKTLENFVYLGLLVTLYPRTRIVYCRRDPRDVCLSCYFQNFQGMDYTWSLEDIGAYSRQYERLMAHWHDVLPLPIFELCYEDLIARQEEITRKLLAHCGLDWDERCLTFYNTRRNVQTASTIQVRKPLSAKSIGRWEHYRAHLGPLLKALQAP
jgi:tetratricopeptide (TPR) repeat protein